MVAYLEHHLHAAGVIKAARDRAMVSGRQPISEIDKVHLRDHASDFTNIYFILCSATGAIKIGRAENVQRRMAALQISTPGTLRLLGSFRAHLTFENFLHSLFSVHRVRGEWFRPADGLLDLIEAGLDGGYITVLELCRKVVEESKVA
ncbi:MAG: hypothetical protein [Podoviridae sp. ctdb7]|nr:MAG: hypothetical protein [Podoviridae sp. ctdb7]